MAQLIHLPNLFIMWLRYSDHLLTTFTTTIDPQTPAILNSNWIEVLKICNSMEFSIWIIALLFIRTIITYRKCIENRLNFWWSKILLDWREKFLTEIFDINDVLNMLTQNRKVSLKIGSNFIWCRWCILKRNRLFWSYVLWKSNRITR